MFKVGDTVLYGREGVCVIEAIEDRKFAGEVRSYYVMNSLAKANSKVYVPTDNATLVAGMRRVLSEKEIKELVCEMNKGEPVWESDDQLRRDEYHRIIAEADCLAMGKNLRSISIKKAELAAEGKKLRRCDEEFFIQGQNILFNEFAHVLNISKDEVLTYILNS